MRYKKKSQIFFEIFILSQISRQMKTWENLSSFLLYSPGLSKLGLTDCLCPSVEMLWETSKYYIKSDRDRIDPYAVI